MVSDAIIVVAHVKMSCNDILIFIYSSISYLDCIHGLKSEKSSARICGLLAEVDEMLHQ